MGNMKPTGPSPFRRNKALSSAADICPRPLGGKLKGVKAAVGFPLQVKENPGMGGMIGLEACSRLGRTVSWCAASIVADVVALNVEAIEAVLPIISRLSIPPVSQMIFNVRPVDVDMLA